MYNVHIFAIFRGQVSQSSKTEPTISGCETMIKYPSAALANHRPAEKFMFPTHLRTQVTSVPTFLLQKIDCEMEKPPTNNIVNIDVKIGERYRGVITDVSGCTMGQLLASPHRGYSSNSFIDWASSHVPEKLLRIIIIIMISKYCTVFFCHNISGIKVNNKYNMLCV